MLIIGGRVLRGSGRWMNGGNEEGRGDECKGTHVLRREAIDCSPTECGRALAGKSEAASTR